MYKIFINEKPFVISTTDPADERLAACKRVQYDEARLLDYVRDTESLRSKGIVMLCEDEELAMKDFCTHFVPIAAAGGIVYNSEKELLLIKRMGKWDLPKGKIDAGENEQEAALREVEEECGIDQLKLGERLATTYHTYKMHNHRFLKITHWFSMRTASAKKLKPQAEEHITEAQWFDPSKIDIGHLDTYLSIKDLLQTVIK